MIKRLLIPLGLGVLLLALALPALPVSAAGSEILELRDQYSKTVVGKDGSHVLISYLGSIHYETVDGSFYPIQTDILPSSKLDWDYEVETGHWQLYIKNDITVGVKKGNNWIGHRLHGIAYLDTATKDYTIIQTTFSDIPTVSGNQIEWNEILYGVDYRLTYTNDTLKEDFVVKQILRDLLSSTGYRPADFGHNTATTYLVPIFEVDWSQSLPLKLKSGVVVNPDEAEYEEPIYFVSPQKDRYFDTNLVSYFPLDYATSANPINPQDPEEEWVYASEKIRKRLIKKNNKHWLLMGVKVTALNQMPAGDIVFDPTETLRPNAAGDETNLLVWPEGSNYTCVDEEIPNENTDYVYANTGSYARDLYNLPASSGSGTINFIKIYFRLRGEAGKDGYAKPSLKSDSTVTDGTEIYVDFGSWATYSEQWNTNPADSGAWEWADIDALQIGISLKTLDYGGGDRARCTQVYVVVDYSGMPDPPTNVAATDGAHTDKVVITWTKSTGATKYEVFRDDVGLGELGDVATYDDTGADTSTITAGNAVATDGDHTDKVALSLSGTSANNGTTHTYKVKAGNATGWSGYSGSDTGYRGHGTLTYQWQADRNGGFANIGGATASTYNDTGSPAPSITAGNAVATDGAHNDKVALSLTGASSDDGATNNYQCVLSAAGCAGQTSAANTGYRGGGALSYQWEADRGASWGDIMGATSSTYDDTAAPAGIVTPGIASASDGAETAHIVLSLAGESVADGATNNYRCKLSAPDAAGQTSGADTGYRTAGAITYAWQRSGADGDAGYGALGGATTDPYNDTTAPAGVITPGTASASDGTETAHVVLSLAGESATDGVGRWYYCEVSAIGASTQDSTHNRGYRTTGALTYQWQRSAADSDASYSNIGGGTADPYNDTGAPAGTITAGNATASDGTSQAYVTLSVIGESANDGAGRYFQCVLSATGATNQTSTSDRGYRTIGVLAYQWQRSAADADADYSNIAGGTTDPYNDNDAPKDAEQRYFRCSLTAPGVSSPSITGVDTGYRGAIPGASMLKTLTPIFIAGVVVVFSLKTRPGTPRGVGVLLRGVMIGLVVFVLAHFLIGLI